MQGLFVCFVLFCVVPIASVYVSEHVINQWVVNAIWAAQCGCGLEYNCPPNFLSRVALSLKRALVAKQNTKQQQQQHHHHQHHHCQHHHQHQSQHPQQPQHHHQQHHQQQQHQQHPHQHTTETEPQHKSTQNQEMKREDSATQTSETAKFDQLISSLYTRRIDFNLTHPEELSTLSVDHVTQLQQTGAVVLNDFVPLEIALEAHNQARKLRQEGHLESAVMGGGWHNKKVRGDSVMWLSENILEDTDNDENPHTEHSEHVPRECSKAFELTGPHGLFEVCIFLNKIREELTQTTSIGLRSNNRGTSQLAFYPGHGTRYTRHLDSVALAPNTPGGARLITIIAYLNPNWVESDEGCLRLFLSKGSHILDVPPTIGTLVIMQSTLIEHEVLPTFKERYAMTHWMY